MAELADAPDLGSGGRKALGVQVPPFAPNAVWQEEPFDRVTRQATGQPCRYHRMKTEFIDLSETRKNLLVEIPTAAVDREIDRLSQKYQQSARLSGFRPGKVPTKLVRKRYRDQILHDVVQGLIPKAVKEALKERGLDPVDAPAIKDVTVEEGHPLTFTAMFEMLPTIDPGEYLGLTLRRPPVEVSEDAIDTAVERLRQEAGKSEPVEGRPASTGDTVTLDLKRRVVMPTASHPAGPPDSERHEGVTIELGGPANPPGFDDELIGLEVGASKEFTLTYPDTHEVADLAGSQVSYAVVVKEIHQRVAPLLDDKFARDVGDFDSVAALRAGVRVDLVETGNRDSDRKVRAELLKQLASRVTVEVPDALVTRDLDRRVEQFVRHLLAQRINPQRAQIDWDAFREEQRAPAIATVHSMLVLDEIAQREKINVTELDIEHEVAKQAEQSGQTPTAVSALLKKEGGIAQLTIGIKREKTIDFLLANATIVTA